VASQHLPECAILAAFASPDHGSDGVDFMQKHAASCAHIRENPRFQALVRKRNRFAFFLVALIVIAYFSYISVLAFSPAWLGAPLAEGMATSLGVPLGLAIIALTVALTAVYVSRANREFDVESTEIRRQAMK